MTKRRVGILLNAVAVASLCLPALVTAASNPLPPGPTPCVSSPNSTHRCPPPKNRVTSPAGPRLGR
jgi:hypothetical protein